MPVLVSGRSITTPHIRDVFNFAGESSCFVLEDFVVAPGWASMNLCEGNSANVFKGCSLRARVVDGIILQSDLQKGWDRGS